MTDSAAAPPPSASSDDRADGETSKRQSFLSMPVAASGRLDRLEFKEEHLSVGRPPSRVTLQRLAEQTEDVWRDVGFV